LKSGHGGIALGMMARTRRELAIAQRPHFPAQRLFGDRQPVFVPEPLDQIDQAPAHHPVHRRDRTSLDHLHQMLAMAIRKPRGLARRLAVDQAVRPLSVELEHPVTHDLQRHAPDPGCLGARGALIDRCQRQKPPRLRRILRLAGERAKLMSIEVSSEWNRHGTLPWFTKLNHTSARPGNHERVSPSGTWYYSYWGQNVDPRAQPQDPEKVAAAIRPDYSLGSHVAALGVAFSTPAMGADFAEGVFVGEHGSWNRSVPVGYKVIFVPFRDGRPAGEPIDFVSGFLVDDGNTRGRPVGVTVDPRGALIVADDLSNTIWRITKN
jgi:hypothetical protein